MKTKKHFRPIPIHPARVRYSLPIKPHRIKLYVITRKEPDDIAELIATSALNGPLTIIAGSEWLPTYALPRVLRRQTIAIKETLEQIHLARAFTCYQMRSILKDTPPIREPLLIVNLLESFFVEDIPLHVRMQVLKQCTAELKMLSISRPVAMIIVRCKGAEYDQFYEELEFIAHETLQIETEAGAAPQIRLF